MGTKPVRRGLSTDKNYAPKFGEIKNRFEGLNFKVGIAIPIYNEKANLQVLIDRLVKVFEINRIRSSTVIVDDNCTDGTSQLANKLARAACKIFFNFGEQTNA